MIRFYLLFIILIFADISPAQISEVQMNKKIDITTKEYMQLWLDVISVELSTGTLFYPDMGKIGCRVNLRINSNNIIEFEIDKDYDTSLTVEENKKNINNKIDLLLVSINDLFRNHFSTLAFSRNSDIEGYWYEQEGLIRIAKWGKGKLSWKMIPRNINGHIVWEKEKK